MSRPRAKLFHAFRILIASAILLVVAYPVRAAGPDLPESPTKKKAVTACMECHDATILVQQRLTKTVWTKEVEKMMRWGALVAPEDKDALIDYFSGSYPVDAAKYKPEITSAQVRRKTSGKVKAVKR